MTLALTSCTTCQKKESDTSAGVPDPIGPDGVSVVVYDQETDQVSMPLWYWKKLVRYIIDTSE